MKIVFSLLTRLKLKKSHFLTILALVTFGCATKPKPRPDKAKAESAFERLEKDILGIKQSEAGGIDEVLNDPDISKREIESFDKPGWVTVKEIKTFDGTTSPDEARNTLLQILRNKAVKKKVGTEVEIVSLLTDVMVSDNNDALEKTAWSGFFKSTVSGLITDENFEDRIIPLDDGFKMELSLNAYVQPVVGQRDPSYYVDASLDSDMLKHGDEIKLSVRTSKDSYMYVLNLMADNNAMLVYPNEFMRDNLIRAGNQITIPDEKYDGKLKLKVGLSPGESFMSESIYVVCTRDKVPMLHNLPKVNEQPIVISKDSKSFLELQHWLSKIPLNRRIEKALMYHVSK